MGTYCGGSRTWLPRPSTATMSTRVTLAVRAPAPVPITAAAHAGGGLVARSRPSGGRRTACAYIGTTCAGTASRAGSSPRPVEGDAPPTGQVKFADVAVRVSIAPTPPVGRAEEASRPAVLCHRVDQVGAVVADVADVVSHLPWNQVWLRDGGEQVAHVVEVGHRGVQPCVDHVRRQH